MSIEDLVDNSNLDELRWGYLSDNFGQRIHAGLTD